LNFQTLNIKNTMSDLKINIGKLTREHKQLKGEMEKVDAAISALGVVYTKVAMDAEYALAKAKTEMSSRMVELEKLLNLQK